MTKTLRVKQYKSVIRRNGKQTLWIKSLGLSGIGSESVIEDSDSTRGLLKRLQHCVIILN